MSQTPDTIGLARILIRRGVKASVARDVADRLADGGPSLVAVPHHDGDRFVQELEGLGVAATRPRSVRGSALAGVRDRLSMSQEQFANAVGIEVRTLQNWERNPARLEGPTALLIKVMERHPEMVRRVANEDDRPV